ncbi:hypothetical protein GCM10010413_43890 [Promicromonospora sukumoe]
MGRRWIANSRIAEADTRKAAVSRAGPRSGAGRVRVTGMTLPHLVCQTYRSREGSVGLTRRIGVIGAWFLVIRDN